MRAARHEVSLPGYSSNDTSQAVRKGLAGRHLRRATVPDAGGLLSHGPRSTAPFCRVRRQDSQGAKPGGLPIEQPTKFTLVVDLKTARLLGITVAESVPLRADEAIR
jgi:putative ABC transport system substrate-binding protein